VKAFTCPPLFKDGIILTSPEDFERYEAPKTEKERNARKLDRSRMIELRKQGESSGKSMVALKLVGIRERIPNEPVAFLTRDQHFGRYYVADAEDDEP
jgi:hypothetical protein